MAHADYIFMAHANLANNAKTRSYDYGSHRSHETCSPPEGAKGNLTKAASQKARSLPTLPLFIEGVRRSREGVTSVARSVFAPHFVWNAPALWAPPL